MALAPPVVTALDRVPLVTHAEADYPERLDAGGALHVELPSDSVVRVPVGADRFALIAYRISIPDTEERVFKARAEMSLDLGATWELLCSFTAGGGAPGPNGVPPGFSSDTSYMTVPLNNPENPNRLIRTIFIPLKALRSRVEVICAQAVRP